MAQARERVFQTELIKGARDRGFHVCPIPDSGGPYGGKKVYDLGFGKDGEWFPTELKHCDGDWFKRDDMEPHQVENLLNARRSGFVSLVICIWEIIEDTGRTHHKTGKKIRRFKHRNAFAVTIERLLAGFDFFGKDRLSFSWWSENGVSLDQIQVQKRDKRGELKFTKTGRPEMELAWSPMPILRNCRAMSLEIVEVFE